MVVNNPFTGIEFRHLVGVPGTLENQCEKSSFRRKKNLAKLTKFIGADFLARKKIFSSNQVSKVCKK